MMKILRIEQIKEKISSAVQLNACQDQWIELRPDTPNLLDRVMAEKEEHNAVQPPFHERIQIRRCVISSHEEGTLALKLRKIVYSSNGSKADIARLDYVSDPFDERSDTERD